MYFLDLRLRFSAAKTVDVGSNIISLEDDLRQD